jgi:hypothetical protein
MAWEHKNTPGFYTWGFIFSAGYSSWFKTSISDKITFRRAVRISLYMKLTS